MKNLAHDILLYLKWINTKDLQCGTGSSVQCYVAAWMGGEFGGEWVHVRVHVYVYVYMYMCVYVWLSSFAVHLKLSQYCKSAKLQYKIKS